MSKILIPTGRTRIRRVTGKQLKQERKAELQSQVRQREVVRPSTVLASSWVADLVALEKTIVLCRACAHKFDHERNRYYRDRKFPWVQGKCAGCKDFEIQAVLYIHESALTGPGGRTVSGQIWTPR